MMRRLAARAIDNFASQRLAADLTLRVLQNSVL
jgi:hypothetical protein